MKVSRHSDYRLPESLRQKLIAFRRRLWTLKIFEAIAAAVIAVLLGFLLTYLLDRLHDSSAIVRLTLLIAASFGTLVIPLAIQRWVIRRRRLDQLARLLSETRPNAGDQLLGVIELADESLDWEQSDQSRSPALVSAAIQQVADNVAQQNLDSAIPNPRHRQRGIIAAVLGAIVIALALATAPAATNAWVRFIAPWKHTPRYTFANVDGLPESVVVAQDEPFRFSVRLSDSSQWNPSTATVSLSGQNSQAGNLDDGRYDFDLPGQLQTGTLVVKVGDFRGQTTIDPKSRPELSSLIAHIELPGYLGRSELVEREIRGSTLSVLKGSQTTLIATATRELINAKVNHAGRRVEGSTFSSEPTSSEKPRSIVLEWKDTHGLAGREPFTLDIDPVDDVAPRVACEGLPRRKVLLDTEVINFRVLASDDYGVKRVGIQWNAIDPQTAHPESGEVIIGGGDPFTDSLELAATFSAVDLKIASQSVSVRVFVEDFFPDRERSYSAESVFEILSADQHAIWITSQLTRWQRMSLDARDRELQLHQTNQELRELTNEQLLLPENQRRLVRQAELERSGGNQLASLVRNGAGLLKEAMRNSEIGAGQLDRWAKMVNTLQEISDNRMPSVAELLSEAANSSAAIAKAKSRRSVGQNRLADQTAGEQQKSSDKDDPADQPPTISDVESSHNDLKGKQASQPTQSKSQQSRLTLPTTMLASPASPQESKQGPSPKDQIAQAVKEQQDLLAQFDEIADELNEVLANLEGSTIVKRLKASSRRQQQVAAQLAMLAAESFGVSDRKKESNADQFQALADAETQSSELTSYIMDDMDAYYQRSRTHGFRRVLDQMREADVTAELRLLGDELREENGLSISQAEFWSDTFDRWAEDLVEASEGGESPGGKAKGSLPPAIVLEVLKLLEGEVNLREQTRVVQQAKSAVPYTSHVESAGRLWKSQHDLQQRAEDVVVQMSELPNAQADFGKEIGMMSKVSQIMIETIEILRRPDTGPNAIAAETEIIELLLESKRFSPSGGGGGAAPGGGGKGDTETPALALVGAGVNAKEFREEMSATQSTGVAGSELPEEFRSGLDTYFNRLEAWRSEQQ